MQRKSLIANESTLSNHIKEERNSEGTEKVQEAIKAIWQSGLKINLDGILKLLSGQKKVQKIQRHTQTLDCRENFLMARKL